MVDFFEVPVIDDRRLQEIGEAIDKHAFAWAVAKCIEGEKCYRVGRQAGRWHVQRTGVCADAPPIGDPRGYAREEQADTVLRAFFADGLISMYLALVEINLAAEQRAVEDSI